MLCPLISTPTPEVVIISQPKKSFLGGSFRDVDHSILRAPAPPKLILIHRIEQTCRVGWAGPLQILLHTGVWGSEVGEHHDQHDHEQVKVKQRDQLRCGSEPGRNRAEQLLPGILTRSRAPDYCSPHHTPTAPQPPLRPQTTGASRLAVSSSVLPPPASASTHGCVTARAGPGSQAAPALRYRVRVGAAQG